jgi:DNA-binding protein Fis
MITILVLEDETRICKLLFQALRQEGYSFVDEPQSGGLIKIVRKERESKSSIGEKILELQSKLLLEKNGKVYKSILNEVEKPLIEAILERVGGNQVKAAKMLGINRNTLRAKIKKLGIKPKSYR